jgi:DNA-binding transcriptional regulator GbsR (MarR family)
MSPEIEAFVERAGLLWENDGLPRIAGRIFGLTLLSPRPLGLDEIAEALGVSKASVSNDTRLLERLGFVARVSQPGDRKDYYQSSDRSFEHVVAERVRWLEELERLITDGRAIAASPIVRSRLGELSSAARHVTRGLARALADLRKMRTSISRKSA